MNFDSAKKIIEESNKQPILRQYLTPAKNHSKDSGYCCIECKSGTGKSGTGAVTIYHDHCTCFSCKKTFRNADIAAHYLGLADCKGDNFFKVAEFLANELNLNYLACDETSTTSKNSSVSKIKPNEGVKLTMEQPKQEQQQKDYTNFYQHAESQLKNFIESQGGKWRGLTYEDLKAVRAGFNKFDDGECIIFSYDKNTYFRRSITDSPKIKMKNSGGKVQIYNPYNVLNSGLPIFAVEGEIDALSIHKAGFNAVALGGASQIDKFLNQLESEFSGKAEKPKLILMFDNNDNGAGQDAATELLSKLRGKKYLAVNVILSPNLQYDSNEFLQEDSAAFSARLAEIYKSAIEEFEQIENEMKLAAEMQRNKNFGKKINFFAQNNYLPSTTRNSKFKDLITGFSNFDKVQKLQPALITIGAPPSLGKTSFIWQLLEQTARQTISTAKIHCIFVSYEMSEEILFSKTFARAVFNKIYHENFDKDDLSNLSSAEIRNGYWYISDFIDECQEVFEELKNDDVDMRILDLSTEPLDIDKLIDRLEKIAAELPTDDILIFAVDYLQRIPPSEKATDIKSAIDYAVSKLKAFTVATSSICFLISSLNRAGYKTEASFESFKESGAIEYTADVMLSLSLVLKEDSAKKESTVTIQSKINQAKKYQPRPMMLSCIKNRFGADYELFFKYWSAVDCFIPCKDTDIAEMLSD